MSSRRYHKLENREVQRGTESQVGHREDDNISKTREASGGCKEPRERTDQRNAEPCHRAPRQQDGRSRRIKKMGKWLVWLMSRDTGRAEEGCR